MNKPHVFLMQGDTLLGELYPYDSDFPWIHCHFHPTPAFEPLRPLFQAELEVIQAQMQTSEEKKEAKDTADAAKDIADWEKVYEPIAALKLRIVDENGKSHTSYPEEYEDVSPLIHIEDNKLFYR